MKSILFLFLLISGVAYGQTTYLIQADSTKFRKVGGGNELIIENATRATTGVLVNYGNGRTRFSKPRINGDTLFVGVDTILGIGASSGASNSNIGSGYRWAVPNTNNVKTLFTTPDTYIDSGYNSNALRLGISKVKTNFYLDYRRTPTDKRPMVWGPNFVFGVGSWGVGAGTPGTTYPDRVAAAFGKTKNTIYQAGAELSSTLYNVWNATNGRRNQDSIFFFDDAWTPLIGMATVVSGLFGVYADFYDIARTCNYIREGWRSIIANYYLDTDTSSVYVLNDANFRKATAADSLATKTTNGVIGLGAFSFTKPAGKTSLVLGTYIADGIRVHQGTIKVEVDGVEYYNKNHDSLNNGNRRGLGFNLKAGFTPAPIVLTNLPSGSATIIVTCSGDSTAMDYIGYLVPASIENKPLFINTYVYGGAFQYFTIPVNNVDSGNLAKQDAVQEFSQLGYPVFLNNDVQRFDSSLHYLDAHPNTAGGAILAEAIIANVVNISQAPTAPSSGSGSYSFSSPLSESAGTVSIANAAADGSTKGAASFTAADFNASSGNIGIDYANAQMASGSVNGFVSTGSQTFAGAKTFTDNVAVTTVGKTLSMFTGTAFGAAVNKITWGSNYDQPALELYNDGSNVYGWGLKPFNMQFFMPNDATFSVNKGSAFNTPGTNEMFAVDASNSKINLNYSTGITASGTSFTPNASAVLEIQSTTQGVLMPRMTATQGSAISSPADGLIIYVTNTNGTFTSVGFWGRESGAWIKL